MTTTGSAPAPQYLFTYLPQSRETITLGQEPPTAHVPRLPAFRAPRGVGVSQAADAYDAEVPALGDLLDGHGAFVSVAPTGGLERRTDPSGTRTWFEATGWRVAGILPVDDFLGPQADDIRAVFAHMTKHIEADTEDARRYDRALEAAFSPYRVYAAAQGAVEGAMTAAGIDMYWWRAYALPCTHGPETMAIAARDLIADGGPWDADAYNFLTRPYRNGFGAEAPAARRLPV